MIENRKFKTIQNKKPRDLNKRVETGFNIMIHKLFLQFVYSILKSINLII